MNPTDRIRRWVSLALVVMTVATTGHGGYRIETVPLPETLRGGLSGVAFAPDGALVVTTRWGEVWWRSTSGAWRRFAAGLNEPMGLVVESTRSVVVAHRPELIRMVDTDGDGWADRHDVVASGWGESSNYHEFFFGLRRDAAGNFLGALSLTSGADNKTLEPGMRRGEFDPRRVVAATGHHADLSRRGWMIRVSPQGAIEPVASGFRQPAGVGLSPDGVVFVTDNQGDFKAACGLLHVEDGDFHGHASSLKWQPGFAVETATLESLWRRSKTPAVVFPHGVMGISAGEPVWDTSAGRFGPFAGQVFVADFGRIVVRSSLERVAGVWQGVCFPFLGRNDRAPHVTGDRLMGGTLHAAFAPDGALWLAATAGWGAGEDGLQRVVWAGEAAPELRDVRVVDDGFRIEFTHPMDPVRLADTARYQVGRFRYYYQPIYGSPRVDETTVPLRSVTVAPDARSVVIRPESFEPGFVYELSVPELRTAEGESLLNPIAYYTLNRRPDGAGPSPGTTRLRRDDEAAPGSANASPLDRVTDAARLRTAGEPLYRLYCAACHQPDGRGIPGGAANFRDDRTRLAKPDDVLLASITQGVEAKGMPAFGGILSIGQRRAVLAYIRGAFGEEKQETPPTGRE